MNNTINIAMIDDHILLRNALSAVINGFDNCKVIYQASDGREFINMVSNNKTVPDVVILDLNMPGMDGYETAAWLNANLPDAQVLMLTMYDSELTLIRLLQSGVKGFLKKDIEPSELKYAINSVVQSGYYYSNQTAGRLANLFRNNGRENIRIQGATLNEQDIRFLKLVCSDMTYKEIAQKMKLSPRAVDALRDHLFIQLDVKSRVGLAMMAIRHGIVSLVH